MVWNSVLKFNPNHGEPHLENSTLLKVATDVAEIMRVIMVMSDDVEKAASPLDRQGKLLRLQNSLQKNRVRIAGHVNKLCDMVEAETGRPVK